ncbi:MAG: hypothetical protein OWQ54_00090 [Sulfolobaceae archaeon]|nr:hypothetical protein [Sulfolobaceae archaeon]
MIDESKVREIVREELESYFIKALREAVKELNLISQDLRQRQAEHDAKFDQFLKGLSELNEFAKNLAKISEENTRAIGELRKQTEDNTKAIIELRKQAEENTKALIELRKQTEENTKAIIELRKQTEDNMKAIIELRKQTEENTRAIIELRKQTEENTKAIARLEKVVEKLVRVVGSLNERVGGLENTFGLVVEDLIRDKLPKWFKEKGIEVSEVNGKAIKFEKRLMEFDVYVEQGNKVYLGEVKATLRERDVRKFYAKVELVRRMLKDKEIVPILIYRLRAKRQIPIKLAKTYGIKVLKYVKGGAFVEV